MMGKHDINGTTRKGASQRPPMIRTKTLVMLVSCLSGIYIGWLLFTFQSFHSLIRNDEIGRRISVDLNYNTGNSKTRKLLHNFQFDRRNAEKAVTEYSKKNGAGGRRMKILTAYLEKAMNDTIPGTGDQCNVEKCVGMPPKFVIPLPLRTTTPHDLKKFEYPKLDSCHNHHAKLPVDAGLILDKDGNRVWNNIGDRQDVNFDVYERAKVCPVDADPWLPWIHDIFPNLDGTKIQILAQNKRRCQSSLRFKDIIKRMEPQAAMMQHVSVERIEDSDVEEIAPELWNPLLGSDAMKEHEEEDFVEGMPRYRLAPMEESDIDGKFTRFICRFHTMEVDSETGQLRDIILGETLSTFPANYELGTWRKRASSMVTPRGKDNALFWLSNLQFDCPVPNNGNLQSAIASGESVLNDGTPSVYVDIAPIRTSPRFGSSEMYLPHWMTGMDKKPKQGTLYDGWEEQLESKLGQIFNTTKRWGDKNVIPRFEASGRWQNLPVCTPPRVYQKNEGKMNKLKNKKKPHTLAACLWASASFHTRGNARTVTDTTTRIREWAEFHLLAGFDHIYVYDNTGAHTNETSLEEALSIFSDSEVTRIEWPFEVCNNNIPAHRNTGERSSQYAAEASCLKRFGPQTEWMGSFDSDEYLIPMGKHTNLKDVVTEAHSKGTNILSFRSTRAYPDFRFTEPSSDHKACGTPEKPQCRVRREDETFLETYNCDEFGLPKPQWAIRAKKQLYRPDHVLSHFVHYSTITKALMETFKSVTDEGRKWSYRYSEDPTERYTHELEEAVMIHTKTTPIEDTSDYEKTCKLGNVKHHNGGKCRVSFPHPGNIKVENATNNEGFEYNCFRNEKVDTYWAPRLHEAMKKRQKK